MISNIQIKKPTNTRVSKTEKKATAETDGHPNGTDYDKVRLSELDINIQTLNYERVSQMLNENLRVEANFMNIKHNTSHKCSTASTSKTASCKRILDFDAPQCGYASPKMKKTCYEESLVSKLSK